MIQNLKGTKDILPDESPVWQAVEDVFRRVPALYGYREIRTPILESTELFTRGVGEGTDIVGKEMYNFKDKGGGDIVLRPELTAPVARAILQYNLLRSDPTLRVWYYGAAFRYERPQLGRQRQFHQIGAECLGSANPEADAEVIIMADTIIRQCGITEFTLNINSLGTAEERAEYRNALTEYLNAHSSLLSEDSLKRMANNPLRTLDSKDEKDKAVTANAPSILNYLGVQSSEHFQQVQALLKAAGVSFVVNPRLVRGLDYYMHTVFEFRTDQLGSQDAIGGGGRYDNLFADIGGKPTPGIGFGLGAERIMLLAAKNNSTPTRRCDALVVSTPEYITEVIALCTALRSQGIATIMDVQRRKFKNQLRDADKSGAKLALILGEDEIKNNSVAIKNMQTGEQTQISRENTDWLGTVKTMVSLE